MIQMPFSVRAVAFALSIGITVASCVMAVVPRDRGVISQSAEPASLVLAAIPRLGVAHYRTEGVYPTLGPGAPDAAFVSRAMEQVIRHDQRAFRRRAFADVSSTSGSLARSCPGRYSITPDLSLVGSSRRIFSVLLPVDRRLICGNDGEDWIAVNLDLESKSKISISQLIGDDGDALRSFASSVRRQLVTGNSCVRASWKVPRARLSYFRVLTPRLENFRSFSLTPRDVAVGFPVGSVAGIPCGRVRALVPYTEIIGILSRYGREATEAVTSVRVREPG